jgi:hypothetical protein
MPVQFRIVPERDLTIVTYSGFVTIDDSLVVAGQYMAHPDFRPDQKFLFDSTDVTGHEKDFVRFFQMQSQMVELFARTGHDQLIGCLAPNDTAREMALLAQRGWAQVEHMVILIHEDEAEVLAFLGQPEPSIAALLTAVGSTA